MNNYTVSYKVDGELSYFDCITESFEQAMELCWLHIPGCSIVFAWIKTEKERSAQA